jgi:hypothetical protein
MVLSDMTNTDEADVYTISTLDFPTEVYTFSTLDFPTEVYTIVTLVFPTNVYTIVTLDLKCEFTTCTYIHCIDCTCEC